MLKEGMIIEGPFWPEPVEVKKIENLNGRIHIIGASINSKTYIDQLLDPSMLEKISIREYLIDFSADSEEFFLALEGERYINASLFDPLLAMNVSKIDPLPFQIEAVYGYVLKLPRIRFLIADDPGAGKTIMAGLIIKELKLRGLAQRILIVVPGHLKDQWRRELKEKFEERFIVLDRNVFSAHYGENPWEKNNQIITSIDFAKQDDILQTLRAVHWDLVVVDEAHKMAAYSYGNKLSKTQRYKLGEVLSQTAVHLLFLTATPHKGDPENFRLFLDLLYPGFFANVKMIEESIKNKDNPLFIRRLKEDLKNFKGEPIFTRRFPKTIKFELSAREKNLYANLSSYIREQYNRALRSDKKRNIAFALIILQRRMASSTYALLKSLERRKERLEKFLRGEIEEEIEKIISMDLEAIDDLEEKERWEKEEEWERVTVARDPVELQKEIDVLNNLISMAKEIIQEEEEKKLEELRKAIEAGFEKIKEVGGKEKILIFTESKDTLEYLVNKIRSWGYSVNYIHGGMSLDDRIKAEKIFKHETQIMVATEAAGEGINLQFCNIMINYDIPWNPNRLEQRMGRIHRYGQRKDVYIFNLVAQDTAEGRVLSRLFEKLEEIKEKLGSDKVFDVIGDVFYGKNLYQLIIDAITNTKTMDEILQEIDITPDEEYLSRIKEILGESLATRYIDYTRMKEFAEKAEEYRLIPEYVEEFFKKAFLKAGGKFRILKDGILSIDSIPYEIKRIAEDVVFKNRFGILMKKYPKVTFDKSIAFNNPEIEFVSFGHPFLEAVLEWVKNKFFDISKRGSVFLDPSGIYDGFIWFLKGEIRDGKGNVVGRKIFGIYDDGITMKEINPSILWDLAPSEEKKQIEKIPDEVKIKSASIEVLENYKKQLLGERIKQSEIKRKYGLKSLDYLINELDAQLVELYERQERGEKVDLPIRNKEEQKKKYEQAYQELQKEIEQEKSLTMSMPEIIGVIRVLPEIREFSSSEEIEKIGMEIAMRFEKEQGRIPEDVSKQNLGFDIRSRGRGEVRYIEVKARADEGKVALTRNEWFKAARFKEKYWLYIVANAKTNPTLYIINNPAQSLNPEEKVEVVRFIVDPSNWKSVAQKIHSGFTKDSNG